ncbi:MAG: ABC transporter permease [Ruminococcus sp.]|nr:ABC transporter permease [Ruminococcus sp.]
MKFMNLFKKELREMVTVQMIAILVMIYLGMTLLGNVMEKQVEKVAKDSAKIVICDQDNTDFTKAVIELMKTPVNGEPNEVTLVEFESEDYAKELDRLDKKSVVIIPKGFTDQVNNGETAEFTYVNRMTSLSTMSNISSGSETAKALITASVTSALYNDKIKNNQLNAKEVAQLEKPVDIKEKTVVAEKTGDIASSTVSSIKQMETMFLPIIVFLLIMYSSQMVLNAVSTEKIDKTLETLLSAPVSRLAVLSSKMLAAGVVAAAYAVVMMFGMNGMLNKIPKGDTEQYKEAIEGLGLTLSGGQFVLVGLQMFVSILIALSISLVLGVLAKDAKSGQSLLLPIQLMSMVPYMLSMFMDIKTLDPVIRYLIYAIPFTHTFMANENLMFGNYTLYFGGLIYQLALLMLCMGFAIRVFTSDRIFTMTLGGKPKKSGGLFGKKKAAHAEDE